MAQVRRVPAARVNRDPAVRELNELWIRTLAADGNASAEVCVTPIRTEIIIRAMQDARYWVRMRRMVREATSVVQKRPENSVEHFAD